MSDKRPRPIRIGDLLIKPENCKVVRRSRDGSCRHDGYGASTFEVSELPVLERGRWTLHGMFLDMGVICHCDGAPIELPTAPGARCSFCGTPEPPATWLHVGMNEVHDAAWWQDHGPKMPTCHEYHQAARRGGYAGWYVTGPSGAVLVKVPS